MNPPKESLKREQSGNSTAQQGIVKPVVERLGAIDYLKGFAMLWIMFVHLGDYWGDSTWRSLWRIIYMAADWLGPTIFVSLTVVSTMISIKKRVYSRKTEGMMADAFKKFSFLFIIGEAMNIFIDNMNSHHLGPWHVLGMNMITAVAFSQLLVYGLIKLSQAQRFAILAALVAGFPMLFMYCINGGIVGSDGNVILDTSTLVTPQAILYYLFLYMSAMMPTYCWLILTPLTMLVFNGFVEFHVKAPVILSLHPRSEPRLRMWYKYHAYRLACAGLVMIFLGIFFGGFEPARCIDFTSGAYADLMNFDAFKFWSLSGIPLFLYRHNPYSIVYNTGLMLVFFAFIYYTRDAPWRNKRGTTRIEIFGKYSFTIFIYSHGFKLIPLQLSMPLFLCVFFPILVLLVMGVPVWDKKLGGAISLEWFRIYYLRFLNHVQHCRANRSGYIS